MSGTTLPLAPDARTLGKYEVLSRLSTGGMAEIFLASQRGLAGFRKLVVLKQILPDIRGEEEFVRMFLDEAKVTAAFNHPHIAQVYDLDIADGELFLSMEFVPGATLVEVARACRQAQHPIPLGFSLMSVRDTAVALHYAHTFTDPLGQPSPVIHRDVAEKNIMVTYEGVTKLLDFGIAKSLARASRTAVGMVKGTSGYMSPEQILGEPLDARSDLFSLGVVLHECLTGMRLFYAKQAEAMMNAVLRCEVTPPSRTNKQVPPELDAIVMRALSKRREDRYATTLEFARALERAVGPLIWHPEQSSELMRRLFADRREQTRQLLASGQAISADTTGELSVARALARGSETPEQPAGGAAPPPPARASTSVPPVKASAQAKPVTPPQGAPSPRRATTGVPTPPPVADEGTLRKAVLQSPPQKRSAARTLSGEVSRPPSEAMTPPPPPPSDSEHSARTMPGRPALAPELTLRGQSQGVPPPRAATESDEATRAEPRPRSPRTLEGMRTVAPSEPPSRGARTHDNIRITAPLPPPPERDDVQTAMVRTPTPPEREGQQGRASPYPERDLQTAMVRPPPPPERDGQQGRASPYPERDLQTAMVRQPPPERDGQSGRASQSSERDGQSSRASQSPERDVPSSRTSSSPERDGHPGRASSSERDVPSSRASQSPERDAPSGRPPPPPEREPQRAVLRAPTSEREPRMSTARTPPPPPQERPEETLSVTPPHPRRSRSGRRRQALPPPGFPPAEATTQPVRAFNPDDDEDSLALGDDDAHENTQGGLRPPRREGRGGMWMAVAGVLLLLVGLGTVAVMMGLDGGRVSARVGPALSRLGVGPKSGTPVPVNTASPKTGTAANAPVAPGPATTVGAGSDAVDSKSATLTDTARTAEAPTDGAAPSTPESPEDTRVALAEPPASDDAPEEKAKGPTDSEASADTQAADEDSPSTKKPRAVAKRSLQKKSRAPGEAPAGSTAEGGSESALADEPGFLTLVTEPNAKAFLGGRELGDTPLFKVKLPAGKHSLKLVDGEGKALKLPVDIKPGEITSVRIPLAMLSGQ